MKLTFALTFFVVLCIANQAVGFWFRRRRTSSVWGWNRGSSNRQWSRTSSSTSSGISESCLGCICRVESGCNHNQKCRYDVNSDSCGPFQIKEDYWIDCYRPGFGYRQCANDYNCAKGCVKAYMKRYGGKKCGTTCEDYARMHNGGPKGCTKSSTDHYWNKIKDQGCWKNS